MAKFPLFELGRIVATPGALDLLQANNQDPQKYLKRHITGDFGDLAPEDKDENQFSIDNNLRILSAYDTPGGRIWIITEADRSTTTILLPDEY